MKMLEGRKMDLLREVLSLRSSESIEKVKLKNEK